MILIPLLAGIALGISLSISASLVQQHFGTGLAGLAVYMTSIVLILLSACALILNCP